MKTTFSKLLAFFASALLLACSNTDFAGGVSEETNTLAGVLENSLGKKAQGVEIYARSLSSVKEFVALDTTDENGRFSFELSAGLYAISAEWESLDLARSVLALSAKNTPAPKEIFYSIVQIKGKDVELSAQLSPADSISFRVAYADSLTPSGVLASLPGTIVNAVADSSGNVSLQNLPQGTYPIRITSPKSSRYDDVWIIVSEGQIFGPFPGNLSPDSLLNAPLPPKFLTAKENPIILPRNEEVDLFAWWLFNRVDSLGTLPFVESIRGNERFYLYGTPAIKSKEGGSLFLGEKDFGVLESDSGAFDLAEAFTIEIQIRLDSTPKKDNFVSNLIGKIGFEESGEASFSLSLIDGNCGVKAPSIAFFVSETGEFDCLSAALDQEFSFNEWIYYTAVFSKGEIRLFRNGEKVSDARVSFEKFPQSSESIYLGKGGVSAEYGELRFTFSALEEAEARIRNLQGGR